MGLPPALPAAFPQRWGGATRAHDLTPGVGHPLSMNGEGELTPALRAFMACEGLDGVMWVGGLFTTDDGAGLLAETLTGFIFWVSIQG